MRISGIRILIIGRIFNQLFFFNDSWELGFLIKIGLEKVAMVELDKAGKRNGLTEVQKVGT